MSAAPSAPASTSHPVPPMDRPEADVPAGVPATTSVGRLLALVRWIIGYGQELADTLRQGADPGRFAAVAFRFQTTDLAVILARVTRGLMLAGALEAKLAQRQGAGRDVTPSPLCLPSARHPRDPMPETKPRVRHTNVIDQPLDHIPSAEAIAAELRRRPVGAVLADICRDLCLRPGDLAPARWEELAQALMAHGGNIATLLFGCPLYDKAKQWARRFLAGQTSDDSSAWVVPDLRPAAAATPTGPPDG